MFDYLWKLCTVREQCIWTLYSRPRRRQATPFIINTKWLTIGNERWTFWAPYSVYKFMKIVTFESFPWWSMCLFLCSTNPFHAFEIFGFQLIVQCSTLRLICTVQSWLRVHDQVIFPKYITLVRISNWKYIVSNSRVAINLSVHLWCFATHVWLIHGRGNLTKPNRYCTSFNQLTVGRGRRTHSVCYLRKDKVHIF